MIGEAPEPGAPVPCGWCGGVFGKHFTHCIAPVYADKHPSGQNLFWLESAKTFAAVLAGRSIGTFPLPTLTIGAYAAAIADELLEEAIKRGRL